jgi:hypothetical protein
MYEFMAVSAERWGGVLNAASGIFGGVVGTAGVVSILAGDDPPFWSRVLQASVGLCVTCVSVLAGTWRLNEARAECVHAQVKFASLAKDIMCQLAQPRHDRRDAPRFIRERLDELEQLRLEAPLISAAARRAYLRRRADSSPTFTPEDQWGSVSSGAADADAAADADTDADADAGGPNAVSASPPLRILVHTGPREHKNGFERAG